MKFSVTEIKAKPGEALKVTLVNLGTTPKFSMGHNWVLIAPATDVQQFLVAAAEVGTVAIVDEREDAATHRDAWFALVAGRRPRLAEQPDLLRLELVEGNAGVFRHEGRGHHVHALLGGPFGSCPGSGAPPDPVAQAR